MTRTLAVALLLTIVTHDASAVAASPGTFPSWDMRAFCGSRLHGEAVDKCVRLQNEAGERVKRLWEETDAVVTDQCTKFVQANDGALPSYVRLEDCINSVLKKNR